MLRPLTVGLSLVALLAPAGCTANPFLTNYAGRREAAVEGPRLVTAPPAEGTATELGTSEFLSSSESDGTSEALAAAADVGADVVMVTKSEATLEDWAARDDVYRRRASGQGQFSSYVPLPGSRERWKFTARFWRTTK
ncbi:MAG: hypothetical protein FGM39_02910 [Phycisphaerales bacterium]|nr:hypothetical protein [Phycisphaerales bacterium]